MYWCESRSYSDTTATKNELFEIDVRRKGNRYEVKMFSSKCRLGLKNARALRSIIHINERTHEFLS